jgi:hypothetical protein
MTSLSLSEYQGRELTAPEIKLLKLWEKRESDFRKTEQQRFEELALIAGSAASVLSNPLQDEKERQEKAKELELEKERKLELHKEKERARHAVLGITPTIDESKAEVFAPVSSNDMDVTDVKEEVVIAATTTGTTTNKRKMDDKDPEEKEEEAQANIVGMEKVSSTSDLEKAKDTTKETTTAAAAASSSSISSTGSRIIKKRMRKDMAADNEEIIDADSLVAHLDMVNYLSKDQEWNPADDDFPDGKEFLLDNFNLLDGSVGNATASFKNTVVFTVEIPKNARRWSINICPRNHRNCGDILLHVNPRYNKKVLHCNDKQGTWGLKREFSMNKPKGTAEALLSSKCEICITITDKAFLIAANKKFVGWFPHRRSIMKYMKDGLSLVIGKSDDNGTLETGVFSNIWWGCKYFKDSFPSSSTTESDGGSFTHCELEIDVPPNVKEELEEMTVMTDKGEGDSAYASISARTLEVSGLPVTNDAVEIQQIEGALFEAFEEFSVEDVQITRNAGVGYIKFKSVDMALDAMRDLQGAEMGEGNESFVLDLARLL